MAYNLFLCVQGPHEAEGNGEDWFSALSCLHSACSETLAIPDALDVVYDGYFRVAGQDKVAVHGMD